MSVFGRKPVSVPSAEAVERELKRERYKHRYRSTLRSTLYSLLVVAAVAVLVATLWLPVLRIYGSSMEPTLNADELVVAVKGSSFSTGDIVGLYANNKLLVKRVIAGPGQTVIIDEDGTVRVDGKPLEEPYIKSNSFGNTNIAFPHTVGENYYFVRGDDRVESLDSRNSAVGDIHAEQIVGRIVFRIWPLKAFGAVGGDKE